jgi:ParB family chromosome partitioning protein
MVKKSVKDIRLTGYDNLFGERPEVIEEQKIFDSIVDIPLQDIEDFPNHPFKVRLDEDMAKMIESIQERGILVPIIVRPKPEGKGYQMVSGHRRKYASEIAELETIPTIVKDYDNDEATIIMVDSNIQRESLLLSEKAYAYKMKYDALKHQGQRVDLTLDQLGPKYIPKHTSQNLAEQMGISKSQIKRYIRLTFLTNELMEMVDNKQISFNPAIELSYLKQEEQEVLLKIMQQEDATPSLSQSQRLKQLSQIGRFNEDVAFSILIEEKPNQKEKIIISSDKLESFFPRNYTPKQKEEVIIKLLEKWSLQQKRSKER